jgi:ketosteroid isomerase-like protein
MHLTRKDLIDVVTQWEQAWNHHDLNGVMALFHDEVFFEHWHNARVKGKKALREAWAPWFAKHGGFRFTTEELIVDETAQKVLYRWILDWPSLEKGYEGKSEKRRGVDVLHFQDGKVIKKITYSKTSFEIDGQRVRLTPSS